MPDSIFEGYERTNATTGVSGCAYADEVEACAVSASKCVGGCSGTALTALTSFLSCFEKGWIEGVCTGAKTKGNTCVSSAGIDSDAFSTCMSSPSTISDLQKQFAKEGANVNMFPKVTINGKDYSDDAQDQSDLDKALCSSGVEAAC